MSWIIQSLLNNKNTIHEANDLDSDQYNDLLLVEKAIKDLTEKGLLVEEDLDVIAEMTGDTPGFDSKPKSQKETMYKKFFSVCDRIAYFMGDYFTDEGYIEYMQKKYRLDEEQTNTMRNYIKSKFKHKIIRKITPARYIDKRIIQGNNNDQHSDKEPDGIQM